MANELIGAGEPMLAPPEKTPDPNAGKVETWGYHATEPARIHYLAPGESLPSGWADSPDAVAAPKAKRGPKPKAADEAEPDKDDHGDGA